MGGSPLPQVKYRKSVIERFWKYTKVQAGCWVWVGSYAVRGGYGQLNDRGKLLKAHRLSYGIAHGKIPRGAHVLHRCNTPPCVNPNHLYAGDNSDNARDRIRAGTQFKIPPMPGEKSPHAKLTAKQVKKIRQSTESGAALARRFGVTRQTIWKLRKGSTWKNT